MCSTKELADRLIKENDGKLLANKQTIIALKSGSSCRRQDNVFPARRGRGIEKILREGKQNGKN